MDQPEVLLHPNAFPPGEFVLNNKTNELAPATENIVEKGFNKLFTIPNFGRKMLVIGSGPNTSFWQNRQAVTLDSDPSVKPDYAMNANGMVPTLDQKSFDTIFVECVPFGDRTNNEVILEALLAQARQLLTPGGRLIIQSAIVTDMSVSHDGRATIDQHRVNNPLTILRELERHGFENNALYRGDVNMVSFNHYQTGDKIIVKDHSSDALAIYYGQNPSLIPLK